MWRTNGPTDTARCRVTCPRLNRLILHYLKKEIAPSPVRPRILGNIFTYSASYVLFSRRLCDSLFFSQSVCQSFGPSGASTGRSICRICWFFCFFLHRCSTVCPDWMWLLTNKRTTATKTFTQKYSLMIALFIERKKKNFPNRYLSKSVFVTFWSKKVRILTPKRTAPET